MSNTIVVIGAGVIGLTSALLLSKDKSNSITVVGKHMPGDYDAEYASPIAGADVIPLSTKENSRWERRTWAVLKKLIEEVPEAGIHFQTTHILWKKEDLESTSSGFSREFYKNPWYKEIFENFRENHPSEIRPGYDAGFQYQGACINTAIYLPWLLGQCIKNGVVIKRGILTDIKEAKHLSHTGKTAKIIVNASGLGSLKLGGVEDKTMAPARGQIILVRNESPKSIPLAMCSSAADGSGEEIYMMQRAAGGGTVIGGTYQIGNWNSQPDPDTANRIMQRVVTMCPEFADNKGVAGLSVVRHAVGFRPWRKGGLRLEEERLDDETWIVHNYGHSGWGYQGSYGCAEGVVELVKKVTDTKSKL